MLVEVAEIVAMQQACITRWHQQGVDNPYAGFQRIACHECSLNFQLWHQEDAARNPAASDAEIALVKRTIDGLNQQRNDCIELMDGWIAQELHRRRVTSRNAPLNSETPGSVIDRLAIQTLRIFYLQQQLPRTDVSRDHCESVNQKLAICIEQRRDLTASLHQLMLDLAGGRKRHKIYRQFKMYNDPTLNPYLYHAESKIRHDLSVVAEMTIAGMRSAA